MSLQLLQAYSLRTMWTIIFTYLFVSLPGMQDVSIGNIQLIHARAFLLLPTYVTIGISLILLLSIQEGTIKKGVCVVSTTIFTAIIAFILFL